MLRLEVNPATLFFANKWVLYGHLQSVCSNYFNSYIKIAEIFTIADFWKVFNNVPSAYNLHQNDIMYKGKRIVSFSLFKEEVTPEWEHPINAQGCELGCREELDADLFQSMWMDLSLSLVNNELDNVVGIRCINKTNRTRYLYKIEIWFDTKVHKDVHTVHNMLRQSFPTCTFNRMDHEFKKQQAQDYNVKCNKRTKKHRGLADMGSSSRSNYLPEM